MKVFAPMRGAIYRAEVGQVVGRFRLVLWFAVASFAVIAFNALLFSYVVSGMAERRILQRDAAVSAQYVNSTVRLVGASSYFQNATPKANAPEVEAFFRQISGLPEVVGANVYGLDRSLLWSSDSGQIGKRFAVNESLEAAFRGELRPKIESTSDPDHERGEEHVDFPAGLTQFVETYIPVLSNEGGTIVGAVEIYKSPSAILQEIGAVKHTIWLGSATGALVLFVALTAIMFAVKRILDDQERRLIEAEKFAVVGELTSAVAHGLRNPLAAIRSSAELALDDDLPASAREPIADIVAQSERLEGWIRSFLLQAREAPSGRPAAVALDDVVRECVGGFVLQAQPRGIALKFEPGGESPRVGINRAELSQVINSLISNSLEAIGSGGEITVRREESESGHVTLIIEDDGPGIAPNIAQRLFEPRATGKTSGLGFGLALSKRILDRCGGTIEIVNRSIKGARATLSLPTLGVKAK